MWVSTGCIQTLPLASDFGLNGEFVFGMDGCVGYMQVLRVNDEKVLVVTYVCI